jgi:hypothetical protein
LLKLRIRGASLYALVLRHGGELLNAKGFCDGVLYNSQNYWTLDISSVVVPNVSLTRLLTQKAEVVLTKGKPLGFVYNPCVKGVSEKLNRVGNRYNIRMIFRTEHTLMSSLMKTRLQRDMQRTAQRIYSILCECDRSYYIGEKFFYVLYPNSEINRITIIIMNTSPTRWNEVLV